MRKSNKEKMRYYFIIGLVLILCTFTYLGVNIHFICNVSTDGLSVEFGGLPPDTIDYIQPPIEDVCQ